MTDLTPPIRWNRLVKGVICYVACLALLVASALIVRDRQHLLATARRAEGVVAGHPYGWAHPEIRFRLPDGESIVFSQGGFHTGYALGETVSVLYLPERPRASAIVDDILPLWDPLALTLALALVFFQAGRRLSRTARSAGSSRRSDASP